MKTSDITFKLDLIKQELQKEQFLLVKLFKFDKVSHGYFVDGMRNIARRIKDCSKISNHIIEKDLKRTTKITKELGEFRVKLYVGGIYQKAADYFTDDKKDAEQTAKFMEAGK